MSSDTAALFSHFAPPEVPPFPVHLTESGRAQLAEQLKRQGDSYDPDWAMVRHPLGHKLYHTRLRGEDMEVHGTLHSLGYAINLLDWGGEAELARAQDILRALLALQDTNPESNSYGIWPWYGEEPLTAMDRPDWNWADFCGVRLLQIPLSHRPRLAPDLAEMVDAAIARACFSIRRRSVGYGYTNIALMGTYVTLIAGETYDCPELLEWAGKRLRGFTAYTRAAGGLLEFNSPTYTLVAIEELGRLLAHARGEEARPLLQELYHTTWAELARHFHAPTRQWAGPHSRCYHTLLPSSMLSLLQRATAGRLDFGIQEPVQFFLSHRLPLDCPQDLEPYLHGEHLPRLERFERRRLPDPPEPDLSEAAVAAAPMVVGTTWLQREYTLGSVNRGNFWDQSRSQLAYFGSADQPCWLRPRMIRDGINFAAVQLYTGQREGLSLAAAVFATDGGLNHIVLDGMPQATFRAADLRFRLEFGGLRGANLPVPRGLDEEISVSLDAVEFRFRMAAAAFGDLDLRWETGTDADGAFLDLVFHHGEERAFNLAAMERAVLCWALQFSTNGAPLPPVETVETKGTLEARCAGLRLSVPVRPAPLGELAAVVQTE